MKRAPIPDFVLSTDVTGKLQGSFDIYGTPTEVSFSGKCRFVEKTSHTINDDGIEVKCSGVIYMNGDIADGVRIRTGTVSIAGETWQVMSADKPRNPDGTVHHTKLYLG